MKKRKMKKYIPRNTDSCGDCKNYIYSHTINDYMVCPKEIGSMEIMEVPIKTRVYKCRYTGRNTLEDVCLDDKCKICGVGEIKAVYSEFDNNFFDEQEMKAICKELDIEIEEGKNVPTLNGEDITLKDVKGIFNE